MLAFLVIFFFVVIPIVIVGAIVYGIYKIITVINKRREFLKQFDNPNSEYYQQHESGREDIEDEDWFKEYQRNVYAAKSKNSRSEAYKELGLSITATNEQAHQKYRELAKIYHPDVNPDPQAAQKFVKIKQAYETILELNQQMV